MKVLLLDKNEIKIAMRLTILLLTTKCLKKKISTLIDFIKEKNKYDNSSRKYSFMYFIYIYGLYKEFVFKGTEDMVQEYHNYWFHIKESLKGEVIALIVCALVGLVIQFIL